MSYGIVCKPRFDGSSGKQATGLLSSVTDRSSLARINKLLRGGQVDEGYMVVFANKLSYLGAVLNVTSQMQANNQWSVFIKREVTEHPPTATRNNDLVQVSEWTIPRFPSRSDHPQ